MVPSEIDRRSSNVDRDPELGRRDAACDTSGWNANTAFTTSTAAGGVTPTSSPNLLLFAAPSSGIFFATL
jgi:hypothetical protein